jgi:hypothetical protein
VDHPLHDCRLIAARAEVQFDALHCDVTKFFEEHPTQLTLRTHRETSHKILDVARDAETFPRPWGITVGEIANSARSALDQMVYALAFEGGGQPERQRTAFPIFEVEKDYWKSQGRGRRKTVRDKYLAGVPDRWKREIDDLQPYHAGDQAHREPLAILAFINNANKHRLQKAACLAIETPSHFVGFSGSDPISEIRISWTPGTNDIDVEAKFKRSRAMDASGQWVAPKMQMDERLSAELIFGEPPRLFDLFDVKNIVKTIGNILGRFEPAFDP